MRNLEIRVRALGPLLVGGWSAPARGGDRASARDVAGRPILPASALRGALRIELERLLRGRDGASAACGANREATPEADPDRTEPCGCPVCRLFGEEGHGIGTLRLEDGVLDGDRTAITVRPHVAVGRRSGTAVGGHLAFLEATAGTGRDEPVFVARAGLVPRGSRDGDPELNEDLRNLRAACAALSALGGGKARGFGWVECTVSEEKGTETAAGAEPRTPPELKGADAVTLTFEARAPLHFGAGRPLGGFLPTRTWAPGSTVRGAVAFALLEQQLCTPDDERFRRLVEPVADGVSFGGARVDGDRPSATRRKCRPRDHVFDDLVGELVRRAAADRGIALALRPGGACGVEGCDATKVRPWAWAGEAPLPDRRVRTRTAINRRTGTAMDRKLYSVEVLEPRSLTPGGRPGAPLLLRAPVRGLDPETLALLARLDGRELWLGGRRSRGMGRCRVRVAAEPSADVDRALRAAEALTRAVREAWRALGEALADPAPELPPVLEPDELLLCTVLDEPWSPGPAADGGDPPGDLLAALERGPLGRSTTAARPFQRFLSLAHEGRFGAVEASRYGAPPSVTRGEAVPVLTVSPGSIYVDRVSREVLERELAGWLALGRNGSGLQREIGWGRFHVRGPAEETL